MDEFFNIPMYKGIWKRIMEIEKDSVSGEYKGFKVETLPLGMNICELF
jgi:hypothetical protein